MALDEPKDTDHCLEIGNINYLIDKPLADKLGRVSVDFVERGWRTGFVIASEKPIGFGLPSCGSDCSC